MKDKTSTRWWRNQGQGSNPGRGFGRGWGNLYGRGRVHGFNTTKPKVWEKWKALRSDVYFTRYEQQEDKYTKKVEAIPNYTKGNLNEGNDIKEWLGELKNFNFNIIRPKKPDSIPLKGSDKAVIMR